MTREVFTPSPLYTIATIGPYPITHPYQVDTEIACTVFQGSTIVELVNGTDFTVAPSSSEITGDITLSAAAFAAYTGASLLIRRESVADQGWAGQTAREKGLEAQLDALTQRLQEIDEAVARAIKLPEDPAPELPLDTSGLFLGFTQTNDLYAGEPVSTSVVTPYAATLLDDTDAQAARATLGKFDTVALLKSDTTLTTANTAVGDIVEAQGFRYQRVASGGDIQSVGDGTALHWDVLPEGSVYHLSAYGALGAGADETSILVTALTGLTTGSTLDFDGMDILVYVGVSGVTTGDAMALSDIPRLFNQHDITLKNGSIKADSPSVSGTKYKFPTTLTIDGCTGIITDNLVVHSKGESWGDTDASAGLGKEDRRTFAAQNGGHALLVVRSENFRSYNSEFRLCGSVGAFYSMSSNDVVLENCFSNPGSLGYAAYAADSWAGDTSVSGFTAHSTVIKNCRSAKEGYTYGSKGCVLGEDSDVIVTVIGGGFRDAYANGSDRDLGYAFGAAGSATMIVSDAFVQNCTSIGYTQALTGGETTLMVSNVKAVDLGKTVHQCKDEATSGNTIFNYTNCVANVLGDRLWAADGDTSRENSSYVALPNSAGRITAQFSQCNFTGATYCFVNDEHLYGRLQFDSCGIETNGWLYATDNIGSGSAGAKLTRGIHFDACYIEDISSETTPYTSLTTTPASYVLIELSTSSIKLNSTRDIETSVVSSPGAFMERYSFPRDEVNIETLAATKTLSPDSAKQQVLDTSAGAAQTLQMQRPDKYKFMQTIVTNSDATYSLFVKDWTGATTLITLAAGETCLVWNDGANDYAKLL